MGPTHHERALGVSAPCRAPGRETGNHAGSASLPASCRFEWAPTIKYIQRFASARLLRLRQPAQPAALGDRQYCKNPHVEPRLMGDEQDSASDSVATVPMRRYCASAENLEKPRRISRLWRLALYVRRWFEDILTITQARIRELARTPVTAHGMSLWVKRTSRPAADTAGIGAQLRVRIRATPTRAISMSRLNSIAASRG
jgi:hypothetical protein